MQHHRQYLNWSIVFFSGYRRTMIDLVDRRLWHNRDFWVIYKSKIIEWWAILSSKQENLHRNKPLSLTNQWLVNQLNVDYHRLIQTMCHVLVCPRRFSLKVHQRSQRNRWPISKRIKNISEEKRMEIYDGIWWIIRDWKKWIDQTRRIGRWPTKRH